MQKKLLILAACVVCVAGIGWGVTSEHQASATKMVVYKTPTCGCCSSWVDHLREAGFEVETHDMDDLSRIKSLNGIPRNLTSCHTALVNGYVVEGHVPASAIKRLLDERPEVAGIAVPGMPIGSPGMEQGSRVDPYDIIAFSRDGKTSVFEQVR
jgi:hypothetical protein